MTEYDFSPEAYEAYIRKQNTVAKWVDKTNSCSLKNPFTPYTPAVQAMQLQENDDYSESRQRHPRRRESHDRRRQDDRERERDRDRDHEHRHRPSTKRHRSASHSESALRPANTRTNTVPPNLHISSHHRQGSMSTTKLASQTKPPPQGYYQQPISPRDSRHSSQSSSTTRVAHPVAYIQQTPPYSAPPAYRPTRAHTHPAGYVYPSQVMLPIRGAIGPVPYPIAQNHLYDPAVRPAPRLRFSSSPLAQVNPQLPYSVYQTKEVPIFKRLWHKFTGSSKRDSQSTHTRNDSYSTLSSPVQHRSPHRKRSTSF